MLGRSWFLRRKNSNRSAKPITFLPNGFNVTVPGRVVVAQRVPQLVYVERETGGAYEAIRP
jgi:hypothetical protein